MRQVGYTLSFGGHTYTQSFQHSLPLCFLKQRLKQKRYCLFLGKQRNSLDNFYCHSVLSATLIHFTYIVTFIICQHLAFVTVSLLLLKILKGSQRQRTQHHVPNHDQFLTQCPDPTLANLGTSMLFKQWEMLIDVTLQFVQLNG